MACSARIVCCIKFRLIEPFNLSSGAATPTIVPQQCGTHKFCCATHRIPEGWKGKMRLSGRGVRCVRGGREVFSGLDFEAASGEALAVTGANGSGKTSLLRMIAGLLTMAGGSIDLEGGEQRADACRTGPLSRPSRRDETGA